MAAKKKRPGRKATTLTIEGDWKDAISRAMKRGKPPAVKRKPKKKGR